MDRDTPLREIEKQINNVRPGYPPANWLAKLWVDAERRTGKPVQECFDEWKRDARLGFLPE
jgi:hypothetical protein